MKILIAIVLLAASSAYSAQVPLSTLLVKKDNAIIELQLMRFERKDKTIESGKNTALIVIARNLTKSETEQQVLFVKYFRGIMFPRDFWSGDLILRSENNQIYLIMLSSAVQDVPIKLRLYSINVDHKVALFADAPPDDFWETWPESKDREVSASTVKSPGGYVIQKTKATSLDRGILVEGRHGNQDDKGPLPLSYFYFDLTNHNWSIFNVQKDPIKAPAP